MRILTEEELYEMSNVRPFRTGLPMVVWIHESSGNERHYARIKVSVNYGDKVNMQEGFFTVTVPNKEIIGDTRNIKNRDITLVKKWIDLNKELIISLFVAEIDMGVFLEKVIMA